MNKILAVDDSPTMHRLFKMIFDPSEYELILSDNGEDGLRKVKEFSPDIVLLDFIMPRMNGFQFCKILRDEYGFHSLPVLLITSKAEDVGDKFIEKFSNVDYIAKPFQPDELVDKVKFFLKLSKLDQTKKEVEVEKILEIKKIESEHFEKEPVYSKTNNIVADAGQKSDTGSAHSVVNEIIDKVQRDIIPTLRSSIEKFLKFETGYMISDIKGENLGIEKFINLLTRHSGILTVFGSEESYKFYFSGGYNVYGYHGEDKMRDLFELYQDVAGVCLLENEDFVSLYTQLRNLQVNDHLIKSVYIFYIISLIDRIVTSDGLRYYVDLVEIEDNFRAKSWLGFDELKKAVFSYREEKAEINKIVYDENMILKQSVSDRGNLKDFEYRVFDLCDGTKTVGRILSFFGNNRQYVKNVLGTLVLTGYLNA